MSSRDRAVSFEPVTWSREEVTIPTYSVLPPDPNPMFLEKRVYQGSSGKVYPYPFTDRISDYKRDQAYDAIFLENEYVRLMLLPSLGGRIQMAVDKTNGYNLFYHNRVIKPALVGLLGPWISGGVEFNWPQHHRPTTMQPLDAEVIENADGSTTVWMGEVERMNGLKGMHGVTLNPGTSMIELKVRLYNPTPLPQTFLWWANVAVRVHDQYESFFPPDVAFVADHARRAITSFPIARGTYYGVDYSKGVAINWYKNIPVPTSYMVTHSDFDFFGGYDHAQEAGFVHVADHRIAPGKKQWTWGNHEFGYAWDRNLTDEDGPYVELMAGAYTDNQPDFSWLQPYETKTFTQCWYPIRDIGAAKNATHQVALNLEVHEGQVRVGLHGNRPLAGCEAVLAAGDRVLLRHRCDLAPDRAVVADALLPVGLREADLSLVLLQDGQELVRYAPMGIEPAGVPEPAQPVPWPHEITTGEDLYLAGLHLEQNRHATRSPEPYYREGLARDGGDARCHNGLGLLLLRRGEFQAAALHFQAAIDRLTRHNPNPYDGEPFYNLGVAHTFLGQWDAAYEAFYKSTWNQAWVSAGCYGLAQLDCRRGDWERALIHLDRSIEHAVLNNRAHNLRAAALRKLGNLDGAVEVAGRVKHRDVLDYWCRNELTLCRDRQGADHDAETERDGLTALMRGQANSYLDLALGYADAGLFDEAQDVLERYVAVAEQAGQRADPQAYYFLGLFSQHRRRPDAVLEYLQLAAEAAPDHCFPNRLQAIEALEFAARRNPGDARAHYYLGNLLYDKTRHEAAIGEWEEARRLDDTFSIVHRNLALGYFNARRDPNAARAAMSEAVRLAPGDARILYELDQLLRMTGAPPTERLALLGDRIEMVESRDDLYLEFVALQTLTGHPDTAIRLLRARNFHPWEGGEGKVPEQWVHSHLIVGRSHLSAGRPAEALAAFLDAAAYPENLGEGKHFLSREAQVFYDIGAAYQALGDAPKSMQYFARAADETDVPSDQNFYKGLALASLGRSEDAREAFRELLVHGQTLAASTATIDYFATSLPSFLIFDDDLDLRNRVLGGYLIGLAHLGLGDMERAKTELRDAAELDPNNLQVATALADLTERGTL